MTTSADEHSALKRNSVHQTRLGLELQQLEKDRSIRLREMQKASQVFARRQEQIQNVRDKACLRRVTSAPPTKKMHGKPDGKPSRGGVASSESLDDESPFVTKAKLESELHKRQVQRTMTMPNMLPSCTSSSQCPSASFATKTQRSVHSGTRRAGFEKPLNEKPANSTRSTRMPMYSRNFSSHHQRGENQTSLTGVQFHGFSSERNRRDSVP